MNASANKLNSDLRKTINAAFQWKMSFNLEAIKKSKK